MMKTRCLLALAVILLLSSSLWAQGSLFNVDSATINQSEKSGTEKSQSATPVSAGSSEIESTSSGYSSFFKKILDAIKKSFALDLPAENKTSAKDFVASANKPVSSSDTPAVRVPGSVTPVKQAETENSEPKAVAAKVDIYNFKAKSFPGFYNASRDQSSAYNLPGILKDVPKMWASYGTLFKKIGAELGADPYALAAFCVFESYNSRTHNYNPKMRDYAPGDGMYAAGIAATQAQDVKGTKVPGLAVYFPKSVSETAEMLRNKPEYAIRCLAIEFKNSYKKTGDLAKTFPLVAFPAWKNPAKSMGAYGTQKQYVSRAFVLYNAFRSADGN